MRRIFTRICVYFSLLLLLAGCFHMQLTGSVAGATITITLLRGGGDPVGACGLRVPVRKAGTAAAYQDRQQRDQANEMCGRDAHVAE